MKKRSLLISFLSVCLAICLSIGFATVKTDLVAKAAIADMAKVDTAIECVMPLEEGKVKNIAEWGYYDSDADGVADVWGFIGNGTATKQPEIRFSTPGTDTTPDSALRTYAPKAYDSITVEYNIVNDGVALAESSTTKYLLQILGALEGTGSANQYYYHIPEIIDDGEWHTLTINLASAFTGGSNEALPMNISTFDDINELVCCWNFKIGSDFNGRVLFRNFTAVESPVIPDAIKVTITADDTFSNTGETAASGFYFRANENQAPYSTDWDLAYKPLTADAVKLVRNGEATNVGNTGAGTIKKYNTSHYFAEGWAIGANSNGYQVGDVYIFNGDFYNEEHNATITFVDVEYEVIAVSAEGVATVAEHVASHEAGQIVPHSNSSITITENSFEFYFRTSENNAAYAENWSIEYCATSVDNVKLTRNGVTTSVAVLNQGLFVRCNKKDHYMKIAAWTASGVLPMQDGDILTFGGTFVQKGDGSQRMVIEETSVKYIGGMLFFSSLGEIDTFEGDYFTSGNTAGAYVTMKANDLPADGDWHFDYAPTSADQIVRIRDGVTESIGKVGSRTIIKYDNTRYYLDSIGTLVEGDVFIIKGLFRGTRNNYLFNVKESYLKVVNGYLVSINPSIVVVDHSGAEIDNMGTLPYGATLESIGVEEIDALERASDDDFDYTFVGWFVGNEPVDYTRAYEGKVVIEPRYTLVAKNAIEAGHGYLEGERDNLYFNMEINAAPYGEGWDIRYAPMTTDAVRRIRGGETVSLAKVGVDVIVKYHKREYFFACEGGNLTDVSIEDGDIFIIGGYFKYVDGEGVKHVIHIDDTYMQINIVEGAKVVKVLNPVAIIANEDGSVASVKAFAKDSHELVEAPETPVKSIEGYTVTFDGWYNGETKWDFATDTVEGCVVLAPKFTVEAIEYTAVFKNGEDVVGEVTYTVETESIVAPVAPECADAGYRLVWAEYELTVGGITVETVREAIEYTLTFVADDETVEEMTFTVETIDQIVFPSVPEKDGYTAVWDMGADELTLADTTVTAVYTEIPVDVPTESEEESVEEPTSEEESVEEPTSEEESVEAPVTSEEESVEAPVTSEKESDSEPAKSGCGGSVGGTAILSIVGLFAAAIIRKRR